ncbi:Bug family tripartite tricarboxylate transporter substrate binding protein [Pollutimonas bauzanensis]|uniref:Tripartite-type tricarboxylate transporter, receptor component TctC n=1 Tax=Pollutimonas bauzanensis TaxID=658167 RepID=A0A1M5Y7B3_9BURK|nr:tripartite tricarboxylate transporter substrate binding protein [Pollutimonas bauzanensis]SHI07970.1 Tripartite-type tricarboxylate transporter, receptor component TctC [Pollutimonas bauzanensis]
MISKTSLVALALALCVPAAAGAQQSYPNRPIRMIVPYAVGGGTDSVARLLASKIGMGLGQSVVVENKPGAGGIIGAGLVAAAPADGYTVLFDAAPFVVNPALRKMTFDAKTDLTPIAQVMTAPDVLVVAADAPYKDYAEFLSYAKSHPGRLTYASAGVGTGQHLAGALFNTQAQVEMLHIPYSGGGPALTALLSGQVSCYFANAASATKFIEAGKLRALAVTSAARSPSLPNVPTLKEMGLPDFDVTEWAGAFVPAGTPKAIVDRLAKEISVATADPAFRSSLASMGVTPVGNTSTEFTAFIGTELVRWAEVIRLNKITLE